MNIYFIYRFSLILINDSSTAEQESYGCKMGVRPFFERNQDLYFNIYYWLRVIFIHAIPCSILIILNVFLISKMRTAFNRRKQLLQQRRRTEIRRLEESNVTTMMLVVVVGIFLIVELPLALY